MLALLLGLAGFLVYHFTVHTIRNQRPVGGANVDVTREEGTTQSVAAFAVDPRRPRTLFGASEELRVYASSDGGRHWAVQASPRLTRGCAHGAPQAVADGRGREYLAFLAAATCGDTLTPYVVVTWRDGPDGRWSAPVRVAPPLWRYGFDDAPSLAVDEGSGRLYLAWTRSLRRNAATVVAASSDDGGRTWSKPVALEPPGDEPHSATVAVSPAGDVYVAGIDSRHGTWLVRSRDRGRSFSRPIAAAPLVANPSSECAFSGFSPIPTEEKTCAGPDPTVLAGRAGVYLVYDDFAANQTADVLVAAFDLALRRRFVARVSPPDRGRAQQFFPAAAIDRRTGVLWACWYDTTFDPHAHRAWFTCSASRDGRTWTSPVRAAAVPTPPNVLYGIQARGGLRTAVAAARGVAHAFWADGRLVDDTTDLFTAGVPQRTAFEQR